MNGGHDMDGMSMPVGDVTPEILLVVGAVVVLVAAPFLRRVRQCWCPLLAMVALASSAVAAFAMLGGGQSSTFFGTYAADDAAVWAKLIILAITAVVLLMSIEWFAADARGGELYALLLLSAAGAIVLASATDLMGVLLGMLLSSATGYEIGRAAVRERVFQYG